MQLLIKKVETLARAIEVESKKIKREAAIREKDSALVKLDEKIRSPNSSKRLALLDFPILFPLYLGVSHEACQFFFY